MNRSRACGGLSTSMTNRPDVVILNVIQTKVMTVRGFRKFQVSVRTLLLLTTLSAIAISIWLCRPTGEVVLNVDESGAVTVDDKSTSASQIAGRLKSKLQWHNLWLTECELVMMPASTTPTSSINKIVKSASELGFEKMVLRVLEMPE